MLLDYYTPYTYKGVWDSTVQYTINDIVQSSSMLFVALGSSLNKDPTTDMVVWGSAPFNFEGTWSSGSTYVKNDAVLGSNNRLYYVFTTPVPSTLNPDPVTNPTPIPWLQVTNTLTSFLSNVRDLIVIGLSEEAIPDNVLVKNIYFRASELEVIDRLGLTEEAYNLKLLSDPNFREKVGIAIERRIAAKALPAYPQILEEAGLNERVRYAELDLSERINLFLSDSNDAIKEFLPVIQGEIFGVANRYVGF